MLQIYTILPPSVSASTRLLLISRFDTELKNCHDQIAQAQIVDDTRDNDLVLTEIE
jgi:hypothetical protein